MPDSHAPQVQLLVGTIKGAFIYTADPDRQNWDLRGPFMHGWEVYSLLADQRGSAPRLIAGTSHAAYGPAIRISDDLGETWRQVEKGPEYSSDSGFNLTRIWQLIPGHATQPETVYAGVDEAGLFVSHDRGESWREVDALTNHPTRPEWFPGGGGLCLHTIMTHPKNPQRMWVGISAVGVFRTDDGGASWQTANQGLIEANTGEPAQEIGSCVHKMVLDPDNPDTIYMQEHCGVFRSDNGGDSWYTIEEGLPKAHLHHPEFWPFGFPMAITRTGDMFIVPLESSEQRTTAAGELAIYRRGRGDAAWVPSGPILPDEPRYTSVLRDAMTVDDQDETGVYFGTTSGDVFYSLDRGDSWTRLPGQLPRVLSVKAWTLNA
ncbi:MAG: exo-alpha-sialidase [Litorilinea sp.]